MTKNDKKEKFDSNKYNAKYQKENYDRLNFLMPKGTKEKIKKAAAFIGITSSEFVRQAIEEKLQKY